MRRMRRIRNGSNCEYCFSHHSLREMQEALTFLALLVPVASASVYIKNNNDNKKKRAPKIRYTHRKRNCSHGSNGTQRFPHRSLREKRQEVLALFVLFCVDPRGIAFVRILRASDMRSGTLDRPIGAHDVYCNRVDMLLSRLNGIGRYRSGAVIGNIETGERCPMLENYGVSRPKSIGTLRFIFV